MTLRGLPGWARTVRMRLALTYSATLFGITALILAGVYFALSQTIVAAPLDPVTVKRFEKKSDGSIAYKPGEQFQAADLDTVQHAVNFTALQTLRDYSAVALAVMFLLSVAVGWWVSGRALRPVEAITRTAQEIGATDLSRRIGATGPRDELRTLADTIDGMLDRLDRAFTAERRLIEDVSHELRNPVMVVQANVEAVLGNEQADREQRAEATAVVLGATSRMSRLLEDLLATARFRGASRSANGPTPARSPTATRTRWAGRSTTCCPTRCGSRRWAARSPWAWGVGRAGPGSPWPTRGRGCRPRRGTGSSTGSTGGRTSAGLGLGRPVGETALGRVLGMRTGRTAPASVWRSPARSPRATTGTCCTPTTARAAARSRSGSPTGRWTARRTAATRRQRATRWLPEHA
jgi:HAMP domain-containing protein